MGLISSLVIGLCRLYVLVLLTPLTVRVRKNMIEYCLYEIIHLITCVYRVVLGLSTHKNRDKIDFCLCEIMYLTYYVCHVNMLLEHSTLFSKIIIRYKWTILTKIISYVSAN